MVLQVFSSSLCVPCGCELFVQLLCVLFQTGKLSFLTSFKYFRISRIIIQAITEVFCFCVFYLLLHSGFFRCLMVFLLLFFSQLLTFLIWLQRLIRLMVLFSAKNTDHVCLYKSIKKTPKNQLQISKEWLLLSDLVTEKISLMKSW